MPAKRKSTDKSVVTLKHFLLKTMQVRGPYQPVIIKCLIEDGGTSKAERIATTLASLDRETVDYYMRTIGRYPKEVLLRHGLVAIGKTEAKLLVDLPRDPAERAELVRICDKKIADYLDSGAEEPGRPAGWGATRVKLIDEAPWCALCGARPRPGNDIELDIDHIIPSSKGGKSEESNLQVLCHRCNRAKGNSLMRAASEAHGAALDTVVGCPFCELSADRIAREMDSVVVVRDKYPVGKGHSLVIPRRHVSNASELTDLEVLETARCVRELVADLKRNNPDISGFNVGYNMGDTAGQTVGHAHCHVIPRRQGDVDDPTGGIRGVVPGKRRY